MYIPDLILQVWGELLEWLVDYVLCMLQQILPACPE